MSEQNIGCTGFINDNLENWTDLAQLNLPGVRGTIKEYKKFNHAFDGDPVYLIELEKPVAVNPISTFKSCWIRVDQFTITGETAHEHLPRKTS